MGSFLSYSIISGLLMLSMYLAYRVFLARENQHGYNRSVLLLIYVVSFTAFPIASFIKRLVADSNVQQTGRINLDITNSEIVAGSGPIWGTVLIWIFLGGMLFITIRTAMTWLCLRRLIRSGEKIRRQGYTLVIVDNDRFAPFSWIKYVIISRSDYENNISSITTHELKHIACRHWIDLLLAQIVCIVNWFNPTAWLMRDELMLVHEYQADMAVIDSGHDAQQYQMILIKKAVGSRFPSLANSLNHSKLKKRITMMYKEKSGAWPKFKALALVPMLALALGTVAVPAVHAAMSTISNNGLSAGKGSEKTSSDKIGDKVFKVTDFNNNGNVTTVTIIGKGLGNNLTVSGGTFTTMGKTYKATALQCNMDGEGTATIVATFPFTSEYENSSMTLDVNGEEIPFDLENFFSKARTIVIRSDSTATSSGAVVVNQSTIGDMEIYIDGVKATYSQMKELSPDQIASITVNRQDNKIEIFLKE